VKHLQKNKNGRRHSGLFELSMTHGWGYHWRQRKGLRPRVSQRKKKKIDHGGKTRTRRGKRGKRGKKNITLASERRGKKALSKATIQEKRKPSRKPGYQSTVETARNIKMKYSAKRS